MEADLEVVRTFAVILVKQLGENNNRITNKEVGNVLRKKVVNSYSVSMVNNANDKAQH
jgi:hypothetical protein